MSTVYVQTQLNISYCQRGINITLAQWCWVATRLEIELWRVVLGSPNVKQGTTPESLGAATYLLSLTRDIYLAVRNTP